MKSNPWILFPLSLLAVVALLLTGACKSSGMAVTERGQLLKININAPDDLPDGGTEELEIVVSNRGVNKINDVEFEVEIPNEIIVISESHGDGMNLTEDRMGGTRRRYHYQVGDIEAGTESKARFHVRTAFGSMDRSGDVKVTAWATALPGNRLIESKQIKLRR